MDKGFEQKWLDTVKKVEEKFGEDLDVQAILFLIGVQELGNGAKNFTKDQKVELLHIAICRILMPFGFYKLVGRDYDGWPHYEILKELPSLKPGEQLRLMKEAIINYFEEELTFDS
ncbi:MAG: hypothetical protein RLZZ414_2224 [Bacteroidota bacterium]|jgi:hypothetical protein